MEDDSGVDLKAKPSGHWSLTDAMWWMMLAIAMSSAAIPESHAATSSPSANVLVTQAELPALVKQAILDDPEIITEAEQKLREKQMAEMRKASEAALRKYKAALIKSDAPSIGSQDADVTMVEFFDYHCGYCKQFYTSIVKLDKTDKKLRIVFREFPILAPDSITAAHTALAVNRIAPDKYFAFYGALMKTAGERFTDKMLMKTAEEVGVNTAKLTAALKDDAISKSIDDELKKDRTMAQAIGIRGTPGIIIGDHLFPGAMSYDTLTKVIADIRDGNDAQAEKDEASGSPVVPSRE
ncbi:MAG TPA: DsbA family protein [Gemmataceae bacterium]|nr:DsbA family protein [Gemmataceae bacterium]